MHHPGICLAFRSRRAPRCVIYNFTLCAYGSLNRAIIVVVSMGAWAAALAAATQHPSIEETRPALFLGSFWLRLSS